MPNNPSNRQPVSWFINPIKRQIAAWRFNLQALSYLTELNLINGKDPIKASGIDFGYTHAGRAVKPPTGALINRPSETLTIGLAINMIDLMQFGGNHFKFTVHVLLRRLARRYHLVWRKSR